MPEDRLDGVTGGKALVYRSEGIVARRRKILRETRRLVAERGLAGFSVRELCQRAGVAQKTLYNAFGGRETVIALAIRHYLDEYTERAPYRLPEDTIEGRLERLVHVQSRNVQIRAYAQAIMAIYHAPATAPEIRAAIREVAEQSALKTAETLQRRGELEVTPQRFAALSREAVYATLSDWCLGDIPDEGFVDQVSEALLIMTVGATRGEAAATARRWIGLIRAGDPEWLRFKAAVATLSPARGASPG